MVARVNHNYAEQLAEDLRAGQATALEKLAITRVVNNELMVGALEAKAAGLLETTKDRTRVERSLSQAERRLMQTIRSLAFLRGVSVAELTRRLPVTEETVEPPRPHKAPA